MASMLPISILKDNKIRYNSSIDYVDGDDIFAEEKINEEVIKECDKEMFFNEYVIQHIKHNHPKLIYKTTKLNIGSIKDCTSIIETKKVEMPAANDIFWLKSNTYIRYYGNNDTFLIPNMYKDIIPSNLNITIYNADISKRDYSFLKDCKIIERTDPQLRYMPETLTYTMFEEERGYFDGETYYLYKNMPINILNNVNTFTYDATINVNTGERLFAGDNMTKFNVYCWDVATYGLTNVIPLKLNDDYTMTPINSSPRIIIAKLLNIPFIPVCLVSSYCPVGNIDNYKKIIINRKDMEKFLSPQILIGEK